VRRVGRVIRLCRTERSQSLAETFQWRCIAAETRAAAHGCFEGIVPYAASRTAFTCVLIQALSYLVRVTGRKAKYLDQLVRELPGQFNAKGYLGEVLDGFDEQQLSGHGWLVAGLVEYWKLTGDKSALESAVRIVENLFLPLQGRIASYPRKPEQRVIGGSYGGNIAAELAGWRLSTDIGCAFISLEGLVPVAIETGREDLKALVCEMFAIYESMDLIEISAQLHSSLSAAGMFLKYHVAFGHPGMLAVARRSYRLFRTTAITENYAKGATLGNKI
jgi:hypothetical protein